MALLPRTTDRPSPCPLPRDGLESAWRADRDSRTGPSPDLTPEPAFTGSGVFGQSQFWPAQQRLLKTGVTGSAKGVSLPHIEAAAIAVFQVKTRITLGAVTTNRVIDSRTVLGQYTGFTVLVKSVALNYVSGGVEQEKALSPEYKSVATAVISS